MTKELFADFIKAQKEFGPALKTSTNPHFKSRYADLSACVEAVVDALHNNNLALMQKTHECTDGVIVETVFMHSSGEMISSGKLHVPAVKKDAQGYGSAMTYARRYSLMAACGIAPEDDDGAQAAKAQVKIGKPSISFAEYEKKHLPTMHAATTHGGDVLKKTLSGLPIEHKKEFWEKHGDQLKQMAASAEQTTD